MKITQRQKQLSKLLFELSDFLPFLRGISLAMDTMWLSKERLEEYDSKLVKIKKGILKKLEDKKISKKQKNKIGKMLVILKQV